MTAAAKFCFVSVDGYMYNTSPKEICTKMGMLNGNVAIQ